MEENHKLVVASRHLLAYLSRCCKLIGKLIHLTITKPNLTYAVHIISRFMQTRRMEHMEPAKRVLHYFTQRRQCSPTSRISHWGTCLVSCRSLIGYFIMLGNSSISWKSKQQTIVSRSSVEAEYRAAFATSELVWIRSFLASLGIFRSTMKLHCDSQKLLHKARNQCFMRERNSLKQIVISFRRSWRQEYSLYLMQVLRTNQSIFSPRLSAELNSNSSRASWALLIYILQLEGGCQDRMQHIFRYILSQQYLVHLVPTN